MTIVDFNSNTLDNLKQSMDFNGYSWFDLDAYQSKGNKPCFIPENADSLQDVKSWNSLFNEALETVKTKDFLLTVCENYDDEIAVKLLEPVKVGTIDFKDVYLEITGDTPEKFAEDFIDSYFLSGDEVWCSLSTKLQDYMM